jgi:hypothetical protein
MPPYILLFEESLLKRVTGMPESSAVVAVSSSPPLLMYGSASGVGDIVA